MPQCSPRLLMFVSYMILATVFNYFLFILFYYWIIVFPNSFLGADGDRLRTRYFFGNFIGDGRPCTLFFPIQFTKPAYIGVLRCAGSNFCRPPVPRKDTANETLIFYVFEKSNLFLSDKSRERPSSIYLLKLF